MVNFEDQDWEELGAPVRQGARAPASAWKIAAGVAIGMVVGGGLVYLVDHGTALSGLSYAVRAFEHVVRVADPAAVPSRAAASAAAPLAAGEATREPLPSTPRPNPPAPPVQRAPAGGGGEADSAAPAQRESDEQKELAWARYYKKPAQCDVSPGRDTIVECANHYIRARREFEAAYAAGKR